jgi:ribonuclease J
VALLTGSQGEPRAALARVAKDDHPEIALAPGDMVIFSSRTIPGNEKAIGRIVNGLVSQGIDIVTDGKQLVHVSGHPRRGEIASLYSWLKPQLVVPVHGEALHMAEHAAFARSLGVPRTMIIRNGQMVRIAGGPPEIVDEVPNGRLYKDGSLLVGASEPVIGERRRLGFVGVATVAMALSPRGELLDGPDIRLFGVPERAADGTPMIDIARDAVLATFEGLPRARRRDRDTIKPAIERALRSAIGQAWGKKPHTQVMVLVAD